MADHTAFQLQNNMLCLFRLMVIVFYKLTIGSFSTKRKCLSVKFLDNSLDLFIPGDFL